MTAVNLYHCPFYGISAKKSPYRLIFNGIACYIILETSQKEGIFMSRYSVLPLRSGRMSGLLCLMLCAAMLFTACGIASDESTTEPIPETSSDPTTVPTETEFVWPANTLLSDCVTFDHGRRNEYAAEAAAWPVFGSELLREQIRSVTFLDTLVNAPENSWDVSAGSDGTVLAWAVENETLYDLYIAAEGGVDSTDDCSTLFAGYVNAEKITFGGCFHTNYATDLSDLFLGCGKLSQVDIQNLDSSAATDLSGMFYECESLAQLDLSNMNTANAEDLSGLFYCCKALTSLDLSSFNTEAVQNMSMMFCGCQALNELNLDSFCTDHVTDFSNMFHMCFSLDSLDLSHFNTASVRDMSHMFYACFELRNLNISSFDTSSVESMYAMFSCCYVLESLDLSHFDTSSVTNMAEFVSNCTNLHTLNLNGFHTAQVTDMSGMFKSCSSLTTLDLSGFETGNVTDVSYMFFECKAVKAADLEHLDFSSVTEFEAFMDGTSWKVLFLE